MIPRRRLSVPCSKPIILRRMLAAAFSLPFRWNSVSQLTSIVYHSSLTRSMELLSRTPPPSKSFYYSFSFFLLTSCTLASFSSFISIQFHFTYGRKHDISLEQRKHTPNVRLLKAALRKLSLLKERFVETFEWISGRIEQNARIEWIPIYFLGLKQN